MNNRFLNIAITYFNFSVGIFGSLMPVLFHKDGTSIVLLGFGFGSIQLYNNIRDGLVDKSRFNSMKPLSVIITLVSLACMSYNVYLYNTRINEILGGAFICLQVFITVLIFAATSGRSLNPGITRNIQRTKTKKKKR
jgi:hypothetical protein